MNFSFTLILKAINFLLYYASFFFYYTAQYNHLLLMYSIYLKITRRIHIFYCVTSPSTPARRGFSISRKQTKFMSKSFHRNVITSSILIDYRCF